MREKAVRIIRQELDKMGLGVKKVILFGSRVRGDHRPDSDWDFLVVLDRDVEASEKREIQRFLRGVLVRSGIPSDILLRSAQQAEQEKNDVGLITYYAYKYGVSV